MSWNVPISGFFRAAAHLLVAVALLFPAANAEVGFAKQGSTEAGSAIRIVHGVANAGPLDVYVDGAIALIGITFGETSADLALEAGDHDFAIVPTGASPDAAIAAGLVTLDPGTRAYAALLGTVEEASVGLYAIDERSVDEGRARFRVVSGVPDSGAITPAFTSGDALSEPLEFGDASQYAAIDAGSYDLEMLEAATGGSLLSLPQTPFAEGTATDLFLIGLVNDGSLQALAASTALTAASIGGQAAQVVSGSCDTLGPVVAELGPVQAGQGASVGVEDTLAVAQGFGLAPLAFTALTETPHAVAVLDAADEDGLTLACGTIGGALTDTGALVIALEAGSRGGPVGIAVLAPSLENPDATGISIFLTAFAADDAGNEPEPVSEETAD